MSRPFHPRIPSENPAPTPEIPAEENPLQPDNNGPDLLIPVLDPGKNAPRFQHPSPEVSFKLPNPSKFNGNPSNYQEFISSMNLYFWAPMNLSKRQKPNHFYPIASFRSRCHLIWFSASVQLPIVIQY
ncbi:hypothetical protein BB559_003757 [Furculomyces boomerangus]|uniref:Uncharacterized protein n=2 Tax=Harpellales TaxID=61421 RepID=A0A2T9YJ19_9FUNG|nr:hypothetical protein BB559_003757 [Furculomyces boomerangus]PVZ96547.1 hypothetical protein BB558_007544 [Smittium angustum]